MSRFLPRSLALLFLSLAGPGVLPAADAGPTTLEKDIKPLFEEYCFDCHNPKKQKGDVDLTAVLANPKMDAHREVWEKVAESLENGDMPPEKKPQPSDSQRDLVVRFVDGQLSKVDCNLEKNPGRVTIRRLNREEYRNTIRDLLGVDFQPTDFPNDEVGYGFDNIGDVLSISPLLMEKYLAAAEEIVGRAIVANPAALSGVKKLKGGEFHPESDGNGSEDGETLALMKTGEATRDVEFPTPGEYTIRVRAFGDRAGLDLPRLGVRLGGRELKTFDVDAEKKPASYEVRVPIEKPGWQKLSVAFLNNYLDNNNPDPKLRGDRNLHVFGVEIVPPAGTAPELPASHRRIVARMPAPGEERPVARELLRPFLKRAWRRPVADAEVERIARFVDLALENKGTFLEGMQVAVQAALCSPQFLFRWELDPPAAKSAGPRELNDYEVASRLAYFLWSSMPDEALLQLADKGELRKNGNLERETARMLKDWKARALVNNFAGQWLQIRNIWEIAPDPQVFPKWTDDLKGMMKEETELFFQAMLAEDRPVLDLIDSDFTFLNEKLAKYYGIPGVSGDQFRRVALPAGSPRGGVLTQGAVLLTTSTPTRTSPVIRGKWILEQILGTPPPAPPADVPPLPEQSAVNQTASLRQRFAEHTKNVECANCHKRMDPLGFALENFDATGAWRDTDGKFPIDATGKLTGGKSFNGAKELKAALKAGNGFATSLTEKLMTYALGRGLDYYDRCAVKSVVDGMKAKENRLSALIAGIVTSDPFLKRQSPEPLAQN